MKLYHATTRQNLASIRQHGLLVAKADPSARIKAVWLASASHRGWGVIHTIRKHRAALEDVVVLEVDVPRGWLTRFRTGLWWSGQDVPPERIGVAIAGTEFGASASE